MAAKLALIFAFFAIAAAAPPTPAPADPVAAITAHVTELTATVQQQLKDLTQSDSGKKTQEALRSGADAIFKQFSEFSTELQKLAVDANTKTAAALEQTRATLQHAAEQLKKDHPEVEKQSTALKAQIQESVSKVSTSVQALAKDLVSNAEQTNAKLAPQVQQAVQNFVQTVQQTFAAATDKAAPKH